MVVKCRIWMPELKYLKIEISIFQNNGGGNNSNRFAYSSREPPMSGGGGGSSSHMTLSNVPEHLTVTNWAWASVGKWTDTHGGGQVWHMIREGRNSQGEEIVYVIIYKKAVPLLPECLVNMKPVPIISNVGTQLGQWVVDLKEDSESLYLPKAEFWNTVKDEKRFTAALFWKDDGRAYGYSLPIKYTLKQERDEFDRIREKLENEMCKVIEGKIYKLNSASILTLFF